jgi:hypothetical protein
VQPPLWASTRFLPTPLRLPTLQQDAPRPRLLTQTLFSRLPENALHLRPLLQHCDADAAAVAVVVAAVELGACLVALVTTLARSA